MTHPGNQDGHHSYVTAVSGQLYARLQAPGSLGLCFFSKLLTVWKKYENLRNSAQCKRLKCIYMPNITVISYFLP